MRVMTDTRRQAIIEIAIGLFREVGYERASMAEISARLGGSKATLYKYFPSKEDLFSAAMLAAVETRGLELCRLLDPETDDMRATLLKYGKAFVELVGGADVLAITRTAVAEGANSRLGAMLYAHGPRRGLMDIVAFVERQQERGILRAADARQVALHLKALLEAGLVEPLLYGTQREYAAGVAVAAAVDAFLRAYAAESAN